MRVTDPGGRPAAASAAAKRRRSAPSEAVSSARRASVACSTGVTCGSGLQEVRDVEVVVEHDTPVVVGRRLRVAGLAVAGGLRVLRRLLLRALLRRDGRRAARAVLAVVSGRGRWRLAVAGLRVAGLA